MPKSRRRKPPLRKVLIETGALVAGAVAGGMLSVLMLGDIWFWNLAFAALGAWLAYTAAERWTAGRPRKKR